MKTNIVYKKNLLIVEDDEILLETLVSSLESIGFKVFSAKNTEDAAFFIREKKVDLITLDLVLPKIDGFTFLKILKADKKTKKIPVLVLSNLGDDLSIKKAKEIGAKNYYIKTETHLDVLCEQVLKLLSY